MKCDCLIYHLQNKNIHDDAQLSTTERQDEKGRGVSMGTMVGKQRKRYGMKKKYKNTCNKQRKKREMLVGNLENNECYRRA